MKRFTETTKWSDPWFRRLPPRLKCLWQHLVDNCDAAGVIDPDWELLSFQIGESVSLADLAEFGERIVSLPGTKIWIRQFIEFQYGRLSEECSAHKPVLRAIALHSLERVLKPYPKAIDSLKDKDKDKERIDEEATREATPATPPRSAKSAPQSPCALRIAALFHRRPETKWSDKEIRAFKALGSISDDDLAAIERYYAAERAKGESGVHRRDLLTFLNHFPGELDRARARPAKPVSTPASRREHDELSALRRRVEAVGMERFRLWLQTEYNRDDVEEALRRADVVQRFLGEKEPPR